MAAKRGRERDPWAEVCDDLARIERRRTQLIAHVEQLRRSQAALLEQPTADTLQRIGPQLRRNYSEVLQHLDRQLKGIRTTQENIGDYITSRDLGGVSGEGEDDGMLADPGTSSSVAGPGGRGSSGGGGSLDEILRRQLPVIKGKALPALCGAIPAPEQYVIPEGHLVAARVISDKEKPEPDWILAVVSRHIRSRDRPGIARYEVVDVDAEEDGSGVRNRYSVTPRNIIPLPTSLPDFTKARPPECEFERDSTVLALYPQTTCFYVGTVVQTPSKRKPQLDYLIAFEGETEGSAPITVAPQFVLHNRRKKSKRE